MMFPLATDLAAAGIPVTVSCRVLDLCRQQYYRWRAEPFTDAEVGLGEVAMRLGHSVETLVAYYVGALEGDDARANERISAALDRARGEQGAEVESDLA